MLFESSVVKGTPSSVLPHSATEHLKHSGQNGFPIARNIWKKIQGNLFQQFKG